MRHAVHTGWIAAFVFAVALCAADMAVGPRMLAAFGSAGSTFARCWNVFGFILPGLLIAGFALALEGPMRRAGARRGGRIGSTLLMLSGLFFAAQGVLPYDSAEPDARTSQLHVVALSLSLIAFLPAAAFVAASLRKDAAWTWLCRLGTLFACVLLLGLVLPPGDWPSLLRDKPGLVQRIMMAAYFGWIALASSVALRAK